MILLLLQLKGDSNHQPTQQAGLCQSDCMSTTYVNSKRTVCSISCRPHMWTGEPHSLEQCTQTQPGALPVYSKVDRVLTVLEHCMSTTQVDRGLTAWTPDAAAWLLPAPSEAGSP